MPTIMDLRSTFPIPTKELLKEIWKRVKRHPMTWMPLAGLGIGAIVDSFLGILFGVGAVAGGALYWKSHWPALKAAASAE